MLSPGTSVESCDTSGSDDAYATYHGPIRRAGTARTSRMAIRKSSLRRRLLRRLLLAVPAVPAACSGSGTGLGARSIPNVRPGPTCAGGLVRHFAHKSKNALHSLSIDSQKDRSPHIGLHQAWYDADLISARRLGLQ